MSYATLAMLSAPAWAVLAVVIYHALVVRPRLNRLSGGTSEHPVAGPDAHAWAAQQADVAKRTEARVAELERLAGRDVYRVGFVRYNSFADVGSDLSFALALLNREGDGVVVSSIYSREETRTFGKSVRKFVPQTDASKEEQQAIAMARTGMGT